jgi:hypothetical protein
MAMDENWHPHNNHQKRRGVLPDSFLGAFEKLRKATVSFIMLLCLSVRPSVHIEELGSHWTDFYEI